MDDLCQLLQANQMHIPSLFAELCYKQKGRMYFLGRTSPHHVEQKAVKENNALLATIRTLDSRHKHMLICRIPTNIRRAKKIARHNPLFDYWGDTAHSIPPEVSPLYVCLNFLSNYNIDMQNQ